MKIHNRVPYMMEQSFFNPTSLHRKTESLSWPTVLYLAGDNAPEILPNGVHLKTFLELSIALDCSIYDLFDLEEN